MSGSAVPGDVRRRHDELSRELREARYRYYVLSAPTMSDAAFDATLRELEALETAHPTLAVDTSPTRQVGAPVDTAFAPVRHPTPMLSLDNAFDRDEIDAWAARVQRGLRGRRGRVRCRPGRRRRLAVRHRAEERRPYLPGALRCPHA